MPVQDSLGVSPQQAVNDVGRTFSLDKVEFAQSPSPWSEPHSPDSSIENVRTGRVAPTDTMCDVRTGWAGSHRVAAVPHNEP